MAVTVANTRTSSAASGWTRLDGQTMEVLNPSTGEVIAEVPRCSEADVERADRRRAQGVGRVADEDAEGPHGAPARARGRHGGERRGAVAARVPERRQAGRDRRRRDPVLGRQPPLLRRRGAEPRGEVRRRVRRGLHVDHPPRAARHRGRHHALELPADDGRLEARPGARRRQRPDPQARRADAADDASLLRARAGRGAAGRRPGDHRRRCARRRRCSSSTRTSASSR